MTSQAQTAALGLPWRIKHGERREHPSRPAAMAGPSLLAVLVRSQQPPCLIGQWQAPVCLAVLVRSQQRQDLIGQWEANGCWLCL